MFPAPLLYCPSRSTLRVVFKNPCAKSKHLISKFLKVSAAIERSFQADFSAKLQPDLPEKPSLAPPARAGVVPDAKRSGRAGVRPSR